MKLSKLFGWVKTKVISLVNWFTSNLLNKKVITEEPKTAAAIVDSNIDITTTDGKDGKSVQYTATYKGKTLFEVKANYGMNFDEPYRAYRDTLALIFEAEQGQHDVAHVARTCEKCLNGTRIPALHDYQVSADVFDELMVDLFGDIAIPKGNNDHQTTLMSRVYWAIDNAITVTRPQNERGLGQVLLYIFMIQQSSRKMKSLFRTK